MNQKLQNILKTFKTDVIDHLRRKEDNFNYTFVQPDKTQSSVKVVDFNCKKTSSIFTETGKRAESKNTAINLHVFEIVSLNQLLTRQSLNSVRE